MTFPELYQQYQEPDDSDMDLWLDEILKQSCQIKLVVTTADEHILVGKPEGPLNIPGGANQGGEATAKRLGRIAGLHIIFGKTVLDLTQGSTPDFLGAYRTVRDKFILPYALDLQHTSSDLPTRKFDYQWLSFDEVEAIVHANEAEVSNLHANFDALAALKLYLDTLPEE